MEQVSWDDVQGFLERLAGLLPDCMADLPTEAEWEYACRAGTTTRYSCGDAIDRDKANYGGLEEKSKGTVPVTSFAPNAWGMYQMHGNVWEWCVDGPRNYDGRPQADPAGPGPEDKEAHRAVRGASQT